jgi:hypothetical protein
VNEAAANAVWHRRLAIGAAALITAFYLGSLLAFGNAGSWVLADALGFTVWILSFTVVGVIIAFHRAGNLIAWICLAFSGVWSIWIFLDGLLAYEASNPGSLSRPDLIAALAYPLWVPGVGLIGFLLLLFPDGHLPTPRWRHVAWLLAGTMAILTLTGFFLPGVIQETEYVNPLGVEALETFDQGVAGFALVVILVLCIGASAVSVVVRYRTAVGTERLQLKWLMAAGVMAAAAYALLFFWDEFNVQLVWSLIPIAIGLSMHRHHLYDIDRLISRTIVYAVVVGALAIVFASVIFVLQVVSPFQDDLAVAASTLAAAAAFNPIRIRVQERVDRRFNRSRFDAERVAVEFATGLRDETDSGQILDGWAVVVARTMQPTSMGIWLKPD